MGLLSDCQVGVDRLLLGLSGLPLADNLLRHPLGLLKADNLLRIHLDPPLADRIIPPSRLHFRDVKSDVLQHRLPVQLL